MNRHVKFLLLSMLLVLSGCATTPLVEPLPPVPLASNAPFVPGEVIVKFKASTDLQAQGSLTVLGTGLHLERSLATTSRLYSANLTSRDQTLAIVKNLSARPDVLYAHPNYLIEAFATPNDPFYDYQWHYRSIKLPTVWDKTTGSSSVRVAILDSGILPNHPDLSSKIVPGYDFVSDVVDAGDGNGRDNNPTDPEGIYHGSHVAGTVAAATNNSRGVAGVSWGARLLPVRVLGVGSGSVADLIDGILWSIGDTVPGVPTNSNPARVLNMSLGADAPCDEVPALQEALNRANTVGAVSIVSAGNDNKDARNYFPASCSNVITVGASTLRTTRAPYSNYGPRIDVMAPGGNLEEDADGDGFPDGVLSTGRDDATGEYTYYFLDGTSMASPHVAGVAALLKSVKPSLTGTEIKSILKSTARPITGSTCSVGCGAGLIDATAAIAAVNGTPTPLTYSYTVNFSTIPAGTLTESVQKGRGITTSTGTITTKIFIGSQRTGLSGKAAMVAGSQRTMLLSKDTRSQVSYAKGGTISFSFSYFGTGKVSAKTIKVVGTTTTGGAIRLYNGSTLLKTVSIPKLAANVTRVLTIDVSNVSRLVTTFTGPGAIDDLIVTSTR